MKQEDNSGYKPVNGLNMYYEIYGEGAPLVLLHGGGSTIHTSFGRILPYLAIERQIIAIELQAHGHTADRDIPSSFEQDADDVAALLELLHIKNTDIFGWSNGGNTAMQVAIRHPALVHKLIVASAFYKRDGLYPQFWNFMAQASLDNMPKALQLAFSEINPDPKALQRMHDKDRDRMLNFVDWDDSTIRSIKVPLLLMAGDQDVVMPEHTVAMYRLLPNGRLAILPSGHCDYIAEVTVAPDQITTSATLAVSIILDFLK